MDVKQQKELEQRLHESLYNNIYLLTAVYPPTKEFNLEFRKDMFVKNNKAGFFQVIHYLLMILDPQQTMEKLKSWPIFDMRGESKFRSELITYLNEINYAYEAADLPMVQPSSLVSPGGFRFAKFMLKVSELVLYEHLSRSGCQVLSLPKTMRGVPPTLIKTPRDNIKKQTLFIENKTRAILENFEKYNLECQEKAKEISENLLKTSDDIRNAKIEFDKVQIEFNEKYPAYPSEESLKEKLNILKSQVNEVVSLKNLFANCEKLIQTIKSSDYTLDYDANNFVVPNEIQHVFSNNNELNLIEYFKALSFLLEKRSFKMPNPTELYVTDVTEKLKDLTLKYELILKDLVLQQNQLENMMDELSSLFRK